MEEILKLFLLVLFVFSFATAGYFAYKYFNEKIMGSRTGRELLTWSLCLVAINLVLFFGGLLLLFKLYFFLTG
jgi:TRAP-type C4-dicarboxylate transport system permease small subunit